MDTANRIIELFGGIRPMARILSRVSGGRVPPTTIQGWSQRGIVPAHRQADILAAARAEGIPLTPSDFFEADPLSSDETHERSQRKGGFELLNVAEMTEADRQTIENGTPGIDLMEAAGGGVARTIEGRFPKQPVCVLCGPGNNGGDGFVVARLLKEKGWPVRLGLLGEAAKLRGDAEVNARRWQDVAGEIEPLTPDILSGAGIIVDALFGAGLVRDIDGVARAVIEKVADSGAIVVAVDVPSGIDGGSGAVRGVAAPARLTVTFFRKKTGHLLMPGKAYAGELEVVDIGIGAKTLERICPSAWENDPAIWLGDFPWPELGSHKYSRGHLVIGGGENMTGAARLAARAAMRVGAGLVTIATTPKAIPIYATYMPGVLTCSLEGKGDFSAYLDDPRRRAVLLGPGYGVDRKTHSHVLTALALGKRVCLDADALTVFAGRGNELFGAIKGNAEAGGAVVITPHEGEFARLFPHLAAGTGGPDKLARARAAAEESGATVLIKGSDTVIAGPDGEAVINGNAPPSLATGGSGDVLAGLIAGLMTQNVGAFQSASIGAWIHGAAAETYGPGLIAEDLPEQVPSVLRILQSL